MSQPAHRSGWVKGLLKYALGFGLLAFVIWRFWEGKPPAAGEPPAPGLKDLLQREPDLVAFGLAAFFITTATALQFYRWYLLVRALDLPFTGRNAVRLGLVGYFFNIFLPGSVGGDLVKAVFIARGQAGRRAAAVATVVADRLFGLFGLVLYVAAVGGGLWLAGNPQIGSNPHLQNIIKFCGIAVAGTLVGWVLLGLLPQHRADRFAGRLHTVPKVGHTLAELWYTVWQYRQRTGTVLACLGLSAITHTCYVLIFHFAVRVFAEPDPANPGAVKDVATLAEHIAVAPIGYIMEALFPAPGGVGGGEAIFGWLYSLLGLPVSVGVAGRLTMRVVQWALGLIGYIAYLRMKDELPIAEAEEAAEQDDPAAEPVGESGKS
ncbi:MAG: lysylphosphatidylglycerol synthase transmembrane domain-containing protein [Gemmataceae bacterium]